MSLINRMLRDLSSRQPASGDVMGGIQVPSAPARRGGSLGRLGLLLVLVGAFTAGLWWLFGPRPATVPQPLGAPPAAVAATQPPPAASEPVPAPVPEQSVPAEAPPVVTPPAVMPATAPEPAHLAMDTELATPPPAAPARKPRPRPPAAAPEAQVPTQEKIPSPPAQASASGITPAAPKVITDEELYAEARLALERGDAKAAENALVQALALNPKLHPAREDLGSLRIRLGRLEEAERNVRIGLELEPGWPGYRRLVARLELARRNPAGALEALEKDPPLIENDPEYHALLASAYQRLNRHEDASRAYQALSRVQPEHASWWAGYAMSRDALGDASAALAGYARARQIGGLDARVLEHINRRTAALQSAG